MFETLCIVLGGILIAAWMRLRGRAPRWPYVVVRSGARWYPWSPRAEDVRLEDLGALAWINRWGGHAGLCSVAEHSVRVADLLARGRHPEWTQLQGLLHDAAEVYPPGDVPAPVLMGPAWMTWSFRWQKRAAERAVRERLGLPRRLSPAVRVADAMALRNERSWRMPADSAADTPLPSSRQERWEPDYAEWRFWLRVGELAAICHAQFQAQRIAETEQGKPSSPEGWDRIVALAELATVARREAARLQPSSLRAA